MASYSIRADETELAALVTRAEAGEEIVLSRDGHAVAKIIPFPVAGATASATQVGSVGTPLRPYGQNFAGIGQMPDDFDDPLPEEYRRAFGMIE